MFTVWHISPRVGLMISASLFANISSCLQLDGNLYIGTSYTCTSSDNNFEMPVPTSGPIKYAPSFDNASRCLLLHRNPDFEVN